MPKIIKDPKETILKIAKFHLLDQGIETLNMRAIARDAEISVGTLYNYFPNKDFIVIALMADFWEGFVREVESLDSTEERCWDNLKVIYKNLVKTMRAFRMEWLSGEGFASEDAKQEGRMQQATYRKRVLSVIERQFEQLECSASGFSNEELARFVFSSWLGMLANPYMDYELFERVLKKTMEA